MFNIEKLYFGRISRLKTGEKPVYSMTVAHNHVMDYSFDELLGLQDHINGLIEDAKRSGVDINVAKPIINV